MTHSLAVRPDTPLPALLASLGRLRAREIALMLPLGAPSQIADANALRQLARFCQLAEKEIVIIGGDQTLRALAVAAGFVVATSLEDHEQRATHYMIRRHPHDTWENSYAEFAARRTPRSSRPLPCDDEPLLDEPPAYVQRLLEDLPALPLAYATPMQRSRRTTRKLPVVSDDDLVREAYESDEDRVTKTIRTTGTLGQSTPNAHHTLLPRAHHTLPTSGDTL